MNPYVLVYKPDTLTSFQTVTLFRKKFPEYQNEKVSYAGRLDPMAEGLLLLLIGEENKKRKAYDNLSKTYEFSVVFGIETDSYDCLGIVKDTSYSISANFGQELHKSVLPFIGKHLQTFPAYSSKPVNGKPLYYWAKRDLLNNLVIPSKEITISACRIIKQDTITANDLYRSIKNRVIQVKGDFRQEEILEKWDKYFSNKRNSTYPLVTFSLTCSSGTYVRQIAQELGQKLRCGAFCLTIKRTTLGEFSLSDAVILV